MPWFTVESRWGDQTQQGGETIESVLAGAGHYGMTQEDFEWNERMDSLNKAGDGAPARPRATMADLKNVLASYPADYQARVAYRDQSAYGTTTPSGRVYVGNSAFRSVSTLESTLDHEYVHFSQLKAGMYPAFGNQIARAVVELQAYGTELAHAQKNGLDSIDMANIKHNIGANAYVLQQEAPDYLNAVIHGNFTLQEADRCPTTVCYIH